jgi:carbamoyltransferase
VKKERCVPVEASKTRDGEPLDLKRWVNTVRSDVPAITHVDGSARVQTVDRETNPRMHSLLSAFKALTGFSILVNTSFNVRNEPIVCTPEDAYRCFMRTGIDILVLDDFVLEKSAQPAWKESARWQEEFGLD